MHNSHARIMTQNGASSMMQSLLSLDDVAELLKVSNAWVRDHATRRNPRIPCVRLGGKRALLRFRPSDVEKFIEQNLQASEREIN